MLDFLAGELPLLTILPTESRLLLGLKVEKGVAGEFEDESDADGVKVKWTWYSTGLIKVTYGPQRARAQCTIRAPTCTMSEDAAATVKRKLAERVASRPGEAAGAGGAGQRVRRN